MTPQEAERLIGEYIKCLGEIEARNPARWSEQQRLEGEAADRAMIQLLKLEAEFL